jgi:dihydrofolate reductase
MRTLYAGLFLSLDGVAEAPNRFVPPYFDEEVGAEVGGGMAATDTVLLGRRLYEEWSAYWPGKTAQDDPFADFINPVRKIVVSTTLESVSWQNATLLREDVDAAIARLKEEDGGDIAVNGSITLARSLLRSGLLDELRLLVFPVVVGSGRRLFDDLEGLPLRLIEAKALRTGVLSLTYGRSDESTASAARVKPG